ncbi:hypothetical protein ACS0TY_021430 [Phlomoides rotata]
MPTTQIHRFGVWAAAVKEGEVAVRRRSALRRVDKELEKGNYRAALSLVKQLKAHPGGLLRGFGAAAPKISSVAFLDELKLGGKSEISSVDAAILHSIKCSLEFQLKEEEEETQTRVSQPDFKKTMEDTYNSIYEHRVMCMQHEAGHFLVGYMLGVFPRRYKVPSVEDLLHDNFARGKVEFVGFEFLRDVGLDTRGRLNNETLKKFTCVVLGGLAAEHLVFGYSELLHSDVSKLDRVFKWLDLREKEAASKTREAVQVAVSILCGQSEAQCRLAQAMALGTSLAFCIDTIETTLNL